MTKTKLFLSNDNSSKKSSTETSVLYPQDNNSHNDNNLTLARLPLPPVRYFEAWNRRDIQAAVQVFAENVIYEDTAFSTPLQGKQQVKNHLITCCKALPSTFTFEMDDLIVQEGNHDTTVSSPSSSKQSRSIIMAQWHVEDSGKVLPFTRGMSLYETTLPLSSSTDGWEIMRGLDFVEPAPFFKTGALDLIIRSLQTQFSNEPVRIIPAILWLAYMYIVFFSDGILPGANALQLEQRTWEEVRDLSLNFFLVAPVLHLAFSPTVHPMLEGVFNLLLSWAAMFAGFLSDERRDKPNLILPLLPTVVGMQLLTSFCYLPYLVTRTSESAAADKNENTLVVHQEDLSRIAQICESRALGPVMAVVGLYSMIWAFFGRYAEFGGLSERWVSFVELLSIDRVGSSFLVDLVIFGLFQGWLIDDDMRRRVGSSPVATTIVRTGKFLPFFGLAVYLFLRPAFPSQNNNS